MYPLRFEPLFRRYLWGGRKLQEFLNKPIGDQPAAESWEIVDHQDDQSVVRFGNLAGQTLRQLIATSGADLVGAELMEQISSPALPVHLQNRFPLLLKFLDANRHLSVQVHPDDELGAKLNPPDLGKTEAWYVVHAEPGAKIYAGLRSGVTENSFRQAIGQGQSESTLHAFEPQQGDCVFIPAGTMHAIGAGLLIAEIQQASNTTFRVYDWGRLDDDGNSRPLHIEQAIEATDFEQGPVSATQPQPCDQPNGETLVSCPQFVLNRRQDKSTFSIGGDGKFRILAVTAGSTNVAGDPCDQPLGLGQSCLIPACLDAVELVPGQDGVEILEIFVPV